MVMTFDVERGAQSEHCATYIVAPGNAYIEGALVRHCRMLEGVVQRGRMIPLSISRDAMYGSS